MMLSDLPRDVAEEVLCRLPVTSLRGVRFTCKNLNALTNDRRFTKKHIGEAKKKQRKEFQVVMTLDYRVCLFSVNLNLLCPSIEPVAKLISLDLADQVDISRIFHCHGVLLCITKDLSSLVVWNPCSGQTRWIQPRDSFNAQDNYALGYERKTKYHKVLRFLYTIDLTSFRSVCEFEIYSFNSNTWKVLDVNPEWQILPYHSGLSLKGNTYWYAHEKRPDTFDLPDFLLCFDFTTERFGPRLPLPFHAPFGNTVSLSSVREKQLAVLFQIPASPTLELQIWISSKIEPDALSWNKVFLKVDMKPLTRFPFFRCNGSFFVDEKNKVAAVLDRSKAKPFHDIVYIIGKKGYFKKVDLGQARQPTCWPRMCSYVPSSMQI